MGFCADWAAHWRYMGASSKAAVGRFAASPLQHIGRGLISPLMFAFVFFLVTLYFNSVLSIVAERQGNRLLAPLEDQGFDWFPFLESFDLPNYLLFALVAATAFRFLPIWPCSKPAIAAMIVRRWFFIEGVIFFFRMFSVSMTSVPQPWAGCVTTATGDVWSEAIYITFGKHHTCGDCMFSGHTAAITLLVLFWTHYSRGEELSICFGTCPGILTSHTDSVGDPMGWKLFDVILWAYALMSFYFILATRFHYSSDVWIGFTFTYFFFKWYHFYLKSLAMRHSSIVSRFMRWFEGINPVEQIARVDRAHDMEAGGGVDRGVASAGVGDATFIAAKPGTNGGVTGAVPAPAFLPVSYLEGNQYYRPGEDKNKDGVSNYVTGKHEDPDAPIARGGGGAYPTIVGASTEVQQFEDNSNLAPPPVVNIHPHSGDRLQTQVAIPVIVPGEQAEQERRERLRERGEVEI